MAFSNQSSGAKSDMNVVPLIDVLLVLLIIFMVTVPATSYEIHIDLPQMTRTPPVTPVDPPKPIRLRIDASGSLFWDNQPLPRAALEPSLKVEATRDPQPLLELETAAEAQYQTLTEVLSIAKNAGMEKIGFVETL
jgi:biopolymer transport protein ExbD